MKTIRDKELDGLFRAADKFIKKSHGTLVVAGPVQIELYGRQLRGLFPESAKQGRVIWHGLVRLLRQDA